MGAVRDIEENFEDLCDALRGFQRDGLCLWVQDALILVLPLHLQAALQGCCEDGNPSLLEENNQCEGSNEE